MITNNSVNTTLSGQVGDGSFAGATAFTTWTPEITFTTPGDLSVSYATNFGAYEIVGNVYILIFNLVFTPTFTTASGNLNITGQPVASNNTAGNVSVGSVFTSGMTWPASFTSLSLQMAAGANVITLGASKAAANYTSFAASNFTTGAAATIAGTIIYLI